MNNVNPTPRVVPTTQPTSVVQNVTINQPPQPVYQPAAVQPAYYQLQHYQPPAGQPPVIQPIVNEEGILPMYYPPERPAPIKMQY